MYTYNEIMLILGTHMPVTGVVCSLYAKHPDAPYAKRYQYRSQLFEKNWVQMYREDMIAVDLGTRFEERTDGLLTEEVWNSLSFIRRCTGSSDGAGVGPGVNTGRGNVVIELFCNAE